MKKGEKRISKSGKPYYNYYQKRKTPWKMERYINRNGNIRYRYPLVLSRNSSYTKIRHYLLKQCFYSCQICGDNKRLVIHHKDGWGYSKTKTPNNSLSNLMVLCNVCHGKIHNLLRARSWSVVCVLRNKNYTFQQIGDELNLSRQRVHQIYKKYFMKAEMSSKKT